MLHLAEIALEAARGLACGLDHHVQEGGVEHAGSGNHLSPLWRGDVGSRSEPGEGHGKTTPSPRLLPQIAVCFAAFTCTHPDPALSPLYVVMETRHVRVFEIATQWLA